eukprot:TRINITY_DN20598_c0_g3_i1.p1 TRINITY_DN20598_c0_g3~~TRINITY_DN20598_c0_g3_i1.p1  ORF type:complete len:1650 (-),score=421.89 TRINITY_DN20598_c0_g3_i1:172-5007(-)
MSPQLGYGCGVRSSRRCAGRGGGGRQRAFPPGGVARALLLLGGAVAHGQASPRPPALRWGQTNTTITVALDAPRLALCAQGVTTKVDAQPVFDRIVLTATCDSDEAQTHQWELELREDVVPETSRVDRLSGGSILIVLRKLIQHRWDRLLMSETQASVSKDWKREDRNLPDEDEVDLPRAMNIRRMTYDKLLAAASKSVVVAALRFPWCNSCVEKDNGFVKASKVVSNKSGFADIVYAAVDVRDNKAAARRWNVTCHKEKCPLHVFKPDEPLDEPYMIEMRILYEMDEYSMMSDPMAGMPGHTPQAKSTKTDFDRFENDLGRLLPPALTPVRTSDELIELRRRWENLVVGVGVNATSLRRAARRLRGVATVVLAEDPALLGSSSLKVAGATSGVELWADAATPERKPLAFDGPRDDLDEEDLERFVRIHSEPVLQNYTWELKHKLDNLGLSIAVLWANYSDVNSTNVTQSAVQAFTNLCNERRGTDPDQHVLCVVQDGSYAYYQREYGCHEPYPFPFFGVTKKLGFGEADRFAYPFKEPQNVSVRKFFSKPKKATKAMNSWVNRVLSGRVQPSHESGGQPEQAKWTRGTVQEVIWKSYDREINGSTADVLIELYDNQRKKAHLAVGTLRVVAMALKDYSNLKVARMETSQNYVPPVYGRKQYEKETEYYVVPPSMAPGELTPGDVVRYTGPVPVTPEKLLHFFKKHSMSRWSLKEALEVSSDLSPEILGQAKNEQAEEDRAEADKQEMIQKMMTTLKKEKGLVDVGEMMNLKKAAQTMGAGEQEKKAADDKKSKKGNKKDEKKGGKKTTSKVSKEDAKAAEEKKRAERREQLRREEERTKKAEKKEKERRKQRREAEKRRKELKKAEEAKEFERKKTLREAKERERRMAPTTPYFSWGQSRESIRISVSVPSLDAEKLSVTVSDDWLALQARDGVGRLYTLSFELREFVVASNSSWAMRYSEEKHPKPDGVTLNLQKAIAHRWDRVGQNHSAIKLFVKRDWVLDDGALEEEEDIDLPSGPNIKKLTARALDKMTAENTMVVAALRLPWCDKCAEKDRYFTQAARLSKDNDLIGGVVFALVDVREEKYLARKHNASICDDRCNLHIFKQDEPGQPYVVPGRRYSEEVQVDCYKHLLPVVNEVPDKETLNKVTGAFDTAIVGFFKGTKAEDTWFPRFKAAARALRGHALFGAIFEGREPRDFGIDRDAEPTPASGTNELAAITVLDDNDTDMSLTSSVAPLSTRPLVLLFKPKENRHVEFTGELNLERLTHFSRVLSLPLLSTYEFETRQKYQELKVPLGMMWLDAEAPERDENVQAKAVLRRLALRFSGHLVFVMLNSTRDGLLMRPMGLDPRRAPTFGISRSDEMEADRFGFDMQAHNAAQRKAFWDDEEQAFSRIESFCAAFLDGTLETSHESADLPPTYRWPGPGYAHEVVWKTFRESVYRTDHHVLLELYSPFRPQHRTYLTVLDLVAEGLKNVTSVKVARMDTANNYVLPEFGVTDKEKTSTLFFIPAAPELHRRPRRFGGRGGKAEALPVKLLRFVHREMHGSEPWDLDERAAWVGKEAIRRIKRLKQLEKDYEKKMQEEWMQKEMEEFERYRKAGKFDNMPSMGM